MKKYLVLPALLFCTQTLAEVVIVVHPSNTATLDNR